MCFFLFSTDVVLVLLAILFPPLPVWIKRGICSVDALINIALCMLGFIPGLLHAWYIIARYPEEPLMDASDLESQDFPRRAASTPGFTTFYTRQQFVYSPVPQQDPSAFPPNSAYPAAPAPSAPESDPANGTAEAAVPESSEAGPSSGEQTPPPYQEAVNSPVDPLADNKIQRHDS